MTQKEKSEFDTEPLDLRRELRLLWNIMWPVTTTSILRWSINATDSAFLGRLGTPKLAGSYEWHVCALFADRAASPPRQT